MQTKTREKILWLIILGVVTFGVTSWTLRSDFYFLFDDIAWIKVVKFDFDVKSFFHILPTARYNDRPIRTFWFWCLYQIFGMNYTGYYFVTLLWHVVDTYLVFLLSKKIFKLITEKADNTIFYKSILIAAFFGIYPKNLMAVYWLAGAANDLLCAFFSLVAMLCYLQYMQNRKSYASMGSPLVFYICAMRSKEAAICLPLIILLFELYVSFVQHKKIKIHIGSVLLTGYMLIYLVRLLSLPATLTTEGQYKQEFKISTVFNVLLNYIRMYFAWDDGSFSYSINEYYTKVGNIGILICIMIVIVVISNIMKRNNVNRCVGYIVLFICCGLSLAPLLVLPNIQHMLYFYFPAIFLSILFGLSIYDSATALFEHRNTKYILIAISFSVLVLLNNVGGGRTIRENFIHWGEEALSTVRCIENIEKLPSNTHVYLYGASEGANVFNYSPGYINNIIYDDPTIITELEADPNSYVEPYVVWYYTDGKCTEIERDLKK